MHVALIIWLFCVPYKRRREMEYLDREYAAKKYIQMDTSRTRYKSTPSATKDLVFNRTPSIQSVASMITIKPSAGLMKASEKPTLMANSISFLPIEEEPKKSTTTMTSEDDQVFVEA